MTVTNKEGCTVLNKHFELYYPIIKLECPDGSFVFRFSLNTNLFICIVGEYSVFRVQILGFGFAIFLGGFYGHN